MISQRQLFELKERSIIEGVSMGEFGRRGGLKAAAKRRRCERSQHKHTDAAIAGCWWNKD